MNDNKTLGNDRRRVSQPLELNVIPTIETVDYNRDLLATRETSTSSGSSLTEALKIFWLM